MPSSASARRRKNAAATSSSSSSSSTGISSKRVPSGPLPSKPTTRLERLLTLLLLSTLCLLSLHAYRLYARPYVHALTSSETYTSPFASRLDNLKGLFKLGAKAVARADPDPNAPEEEQGASLKDVLFDMLSEDNSIEDQGLDAAEGWSYGTLEDMQAALYGNKVEGEYSFKAGERSHLGKQVSEGEDPGASAKKMAQQGPEAERRSRFKRLAALVKGWNSDVQEEGAIADDINQAAEI
ncbi:hypothetical protein OC844_007950 [Tilletia horrida]|nr:hypothetical protein OC844_007950 [Tilletia horrida]